MAGEDISATPTPNGYIFSEFPNIDAAIEQARTGTKEVGEYVFSDGSVLFMSSTSATESSFTLYYVSTFGDGTPWQYHPGGSTIVSEADANALDSIYKWSGKNDGLGMWIVTSDDANNPWK